MKGLTAVLLLSVLLRQTCLLTSRGSKEKSMNIRKTMMNNYLQTPEEEKCIKSKHDEMKLLSQSKEDIPMDKKDEDNHPKDANFRRIRLPIFDNIQVGNALKVILPGDIEATVNVLSKSPFVFEVDDFIDGEDCELLIELAKAKTLKPLENKISAVKFNDAERIFKEWDYDQNGFITPDEVELLPGLADVKFTLEDVDDMFFVLKMDRNSDGQVDLDEMKGTDFTKAKKYFDIIKSDEKRKRNITLEAAWVWHDSDELLKFSEDGYFEKYHDRLSHVTGIPTEILEESEPLQVKHFSTNQFQIEHQDSEPVGKDIPCCLYGDVGKVCRLCRYISYSIFLNDVEEGGELAFPLANHKYENVMDNSGEWRGYYVYSKTTGSKFYYKVDMRFSTEGANSVFQGDGKDESGEFLFLHGIMIGDTVKFEKKYTSESSEDNSIKYHGKLIDGTKISGFWWVPGHRRLRGTFFMWNRDYEIFTARAIDESHKKQNCARASLSIKPKKGKAVFWYNHKLNGRDGMVGDIDKESMSAQCEVGKGEKWIATSWVNIIGDGDLTLRAWRRGNNLLVDKIKQKNIFKMLGTNESKLHYEGYETEYFEEILGTNRTTEGLHGYYKHKPASNALQALQLLFNDMTAEQLRLIANTVHKKIGMTCIPLTV